MTLKLCYISENEAFFTSQELSEQGGDNWDSDEYQSYAGAGEPYSPDRYKDFNEDATPKWIIQKVIFTGKFKYPCTGLRECPYSVRMINEGKVPWLIPYDKSHPSIMAGYTLEDFTKFIKILCPRCKAETNNDFGENCRLYAEVMGDMKDLRFMCDKCAVWARGRLGTLLGVRGSDFNPFH